MHREALDDAFAKFDKFERRMDNLEGQLESMDMGRDVSDLAAEIDNLVEDEKVNEELARFFHNSRAVTDTGQQTPEQPRTVTGESPNEIF